MKKTLLLALFIILVFGCARMQGKGTSDFTGTWLGSAENTGSDNPTFLLIIEQKGSTISGILTSMDGTFQKVSIVNAALNNGTLTFRAVSNGGDRYRGHIFDFSMNRNGENIQGRWRDVLYGNQGSLTLTKQKE